MKLPVFQVDAFTGRALGGNPAVIVCLDEWLDDRTLLAIAQEHNAPTTAFLREAEDAYEIRYFLPIGELPLVGHASLAAAHVLLRLRHPQRRSAVLQRRGGTLRVATAGDRDVAIHLSPAQASPCAAPVGLQEALGVPIEQVLVNGAQYFAVLRSRDEVARVTPDMEVLMRLDRDGVVVTASGGGDCDFVSRAFAPKEGLPEDPVCGSAHLALAPYWAERLGKRDMQALQLSSRGGALHCTLDADGVRLAGRCALYLEGTLTL